MIVIGQLMLLMAFVAAGYSAFACALGWRIDGRRMQYSGLGAAIVSVCALSAMIVILAHALAVKDFSFSYVAQYSSRTLPWHYSLSALWVGQSGSLLLWSWFLGIVTLIYRFFPGKAESSLRDLTFSILMSYLAFLTAVMVFGADPMEPSLSPTGEGAGLSPLLQHPAMLAHPPIVFLGYAIWAVPFALALSALLTGRVSRDWVQQARTWSLSAWVVLGIGILVGAKWAYDELGWGGYWGWDPVENGSLMPWLTGTALIHCGLAWQYRGLFKKATLLLAIVTFALCNFATFLTRSGIFGSVHEFSKSPIGWLFLALMALLVFVAAYGVPLRRKQLCGDSRISSIWTREAFVAISTVALLALTVVVFLGTLTVPLSGMIFPRRLMVGPEFYNYALIPIGLVILSHTAMAPVLRWGTAPGPAERRVLVGAAVSSTLITLMAVLMGIRHAIELAVTWTAVLAVAVFAGMLFLDYRNGTVDRSWIGLIKTLRIHRRRYAGFSIHLGLVCLAVGVAASSLGTQRLETTIERGETLQWAGRSIRFAGINQQRLSDKLVVEAQLEVSDQSGRTVTLVPAQHLHTPQNEWTTEVAIDSRWKGDFYVILHSGTGSDRINVTFVENPLMRWIWTGGLIIGFSALVAVWPTRAARTVSTTRSQSKDIRTDKPSKIVPALHRTSSEKRQSINHSAKP